MSDDLENTLPHRVVDELMDRASELTEGEEGVNVLMIVSHGRDASTAGIREDGQDPDVEWLLGLMLHHLSAIAEAAGVPLSIAQLPNGRNQG